MSAGSAQTTTGRMVRGSVKWFNPEKGYGFIGVETGEYAGRDFFVHYSAVEGKGHRHLEDGQAVEFDIAQTQKGPVAANVVAIGAPPPKPAPQAAPLADALKHLKAASAIVEREMRKLQPEPTKEAQT